MWKERNRLQPANALRRGGLSSPIIKNITDPRWRHRSHLTKIPIRSLEFLPCIDVSCVLFVGNAGIAEKSQPGLKLTIKEADQEIMVLSEIN